MKLLTRRIRKQLPQLGQSDVTDPIAQIRFFCWCIDWNWYVTEFDGEDTFFGLIQTPKKETLCHFRLYDLEEECEGPGTPVVRDNQFKPTPLSKLRTKAA